jgi:hypothetical protein
VARTCGGNSREQMDRRAVVHLQPLRSAAACRLPSVLPQPTRSSASRNARTVACASGATRTCRYTTTSLEHPTGRQAEHAGEITTIAESRPVPRCRLRRRSLDAHNGGTRQIDAAARFPDGRSELRCHRGGPAPPARLRRLRRRCRGSTLKNHAADGSGSSSHPAHRTWPAHCD